MPAKPLSSQVPIVQPNGTPTPEFQRAWQGLSAETSQAPGIYVRKGQLSGWAGATGTTSRAAFTTYTAPTISNPPTQAEVQAIANHVQILSRLMGGVIADLKTAQLFTA